MIINERNGGMDMKKLEIIVKTEKLEELKDTLVSLGIKGLMLTNIMGFGNQKGYTQVYRGAKYTVNLLPKVKVETVVRDEICEEAIQKILDVVSTGSIGDGKIFVYNVEDAIRIRTGERGNDAI